MKGIQDKDRPACEDRALSDYAEAIRLDPKYASANNNRAWICADLQGRSVPKREGGSRGGHEGMRTHRLEEPRLYRTRCPAAYAEIGDFEKAIRWQKKGPFSGPVYQQEEGENAKVKLRSTASRNRSRE